MKMEMKYLNVEADTPCRQVGNLLLVEGTFLWHI